MNIVCYNREDNSLEELDEYNIGDVEQYLRMRYHPLWSGFDTSEEDFVMIVANFCDAKVTLALENMLYNSGIAYANWESDPCDIEGLTQVLEDNNVKHVFCNSEVKELIKSSINKSINYYRI